MQAASTALPELDALWQQAVTAPVFGAMRLTVTKALLGGFNQAFELRTIGDHSTLR